MKEWRVVWGNYGDAAKKTVKRKKKKVNLLEA
jgi:hypothetical protein